MICGTAKISPQIQRRDQDRAHRVEVERELEHPLDELPEHDVERDRAGHHHE
jgi:hypothetical protein